MTSIAPWLAVPAAPAAIRWYEAALGAAVDYALEAGPEAGVVVAELSVDGATFWVQEDADRAPRSDAEVAVRMIVTVDDPDAAFDRAVRAGAREIAAVHDEHGWRTGRVRDPFGYDWEFSRPDQVDA